MHSIGIYETGCTYGSTCKKKHKRPSIEPPENDVVTAAGNAKPVSSMSTGAKRVSIMAMGASPEANGDEYVLKELAVSEIESRDFNVAPNKTNYWIKNKKIWLQPEGEEGTLCQHCDEGHSTITPCSDGGQHLLLSQQMALALAASSQDPNNPLKWASYASQVHAGYTRRAGKCSTGDGHKGEKSTCVFDGWEGEESSMPQHYREGMRESTR